MVEEYKNKPIYFSCGVHTNHKAGIKTANTKRIIALPIKLHAKLCYISLATQPKVTWCKNPRMVNHFHFSYKCNVLKPWSVYITRCQGWETSNSAGLINKQPHSVDIGVATQKSPKLECLAKTACNTDNFPHPTPRYVVWIVSDLPKIQYLTCDSIIPFYPNGYPIINVLCAVEFPSLPSLAVEVHLETTTHNEVTAAFNHKSDVLPTLILHGVGSVTKPSAGNPSQLDTDRCLCSGVTVTKKVGSSKPESDFAFLFQ
jgi:hypothetical protein